MAKEQIMKRLSSVASLEAKRETIVKSRDPLRPTIFICGGTGCTALGAKDVIAAFKEEIEKQGLNDRVSLKITGCLGFCERGPRVPRRGLRQPQSFPTTSFCHPTESGIRIDSDWRSDLFQQRKIQCAVGVEDRFPEICRQARCQ